MCVLPKRQTTNLSGVDRSVQAQTYINYSMKHVSTNVRIYCMLLNQHEQNPDWRLLLMLQTTGATTTLKLCAASQGALPMVQVLI